MYCMFLQSFKFHQIVLANELQCWLSDLLKIHSIKQVQLLIWGLRNWRVEIWWVEDWQMRGESWSDTERISCCLLKKIWENSQFAAGLKILIRDAAIFSSENILWSVFRNSVTSQSPLIRIFLVYQNFWCVPDWAFRNLTELLLLCIFYFVLWLVMMINA